MEFNLLPKLPQINDIQNLLSPDSRDPELPAALIRLFEKTDWHRRFHLDNAREHYDESRFIEDIYTLSQLDGSLGWMMAIYATHNLMMSDWADERLLRDLWEDSKTCWIAGSMNPEGTPEVEATSQEKFRISGTWQTVSGCRHADWIYLRFEREGEDGMEPCLAVVPAGEVVIQDDWDAFGLCQTGSHRVVVKALDVPAYRIVKRGKTCPNRLSNSGWSITPTLHMSIATVVLGCAVTALSSYEHHLAQIEKPGSFALRASGEARVRLAMLWSEVRKRCRTGRPMAQGPGDRSPRCEHASDSDEVENAAFHATISFVAADAAQICQSLFLASGSEATKRRSMFQKAYADCLAASRHKSLFAEKHLIQLGQASHLALRRSQPVG